MSLRALAIVLFTATLSACSVGHPVVGLLPELPDDAVAESTALALLGLTGAGLGEASGGSGAACTPTFSNGLYTGCDLSASFTGLVSTPYGPAQGSTTSAYTDATGNAARFRFPYGITTDGTNLYVADQGNNVIRQIAIATGVVTTLAGSGAAGDADGTGTGAQFRTPAGITTDGTNLYVVDAANHKIRQIVIATGVVTTLAGAAPGSNPSGYIDATGNAARFDTPLGITTDGTNLFVCGYSHYVRQIVIATRAVTTLAGTGGAGDADGTGTAASFDQPSDLVTDGTYVYVSDSGNNKIRRVEVASRVVTTPYGPASGSTAFGDVDAFGNAARFNNLVGITTDGINLYVADTSNNKIRRVETATGAVTTLAGDGGTGDTDGTPGRFSLPRGIVSNATSLFVADLNNNKIRQVD